MHYRVDKGSQMVWFNWNEELYDYGGNGVLEMIVYTKNVFVVRQARFDPQKEIRMTPTNYIFVVFLESTSF